MNAKLWFRFIVMGLMLSALVLAGCEGDDGDDGSPGVAGTDGTDGADGADGSEVSVEDLADLGLVFADDVTAMNITLDLSRTVALDSATGALTIHFFLTDEDGNGIDVTALPYELRFYVSELIPDIPNVADNPGPAFNQLFNERGTPAVDDRLAGTLTLVDAVTGEYTYLTAAALAPSTNVDRVTVRARYRFNDLAGNRVVVANPVNASYDFLQSDPGTALASSGADMVTTTACDSCHGDRIGDVGHGGGYTQVKTCNACHNINYLGSPDAEADLAFMIHRIHDAGDFAELDHGDPVSFSEVTYPQYIYTCSKCHDGPEADLAYEDPTRRNCDSCHSEINWETGENHAGGAIDNDQACVYCHSADAIENVYHMPELPVADISEFDVAIAMTAPANGEYYVAGEAPVVTVTLASLDEGPAAVYNTAVDDEGSRDGFLSQANLFVFGPRFNALPVLTTGSTTDPMYNSAVAPKQGHALFTGTTDPQVVTDATGFKYQLLEIPEDLEDGTYMIRFEGADYGAISDTDYVTSSSVLINFQVGTADVEPKLSGDACYDCHGETIMHLEGAHPHHAFFNTDECLGCHDRSGNYGDYIGNRVHSVHSASPTGDSISNHPTDWSEVTYPQEANNCLECHTNLDADTPVWRLPGLVACGGCHGTDAEAIPADYPDADPERVVAESSAAAHMYSNGGTADPQDVVTTECLVCHGEGRIADPAITHDLIQFRPLPEDPNE